MVALHRCRFVDWTPSPITALAVLDSSPLVVGRQNGSIELYRTSPWRLDSVLPGPADTKVDALALVSQRQLRLFSLPGNENLFEWDLQSGTVRVRTFPAPRLPPIHSPALSSPEPLISASAPISLRFSHISILNYQNLILSPLCQHTIPSQGGTIWSLAPNPTGTLLAIACQDGAIRLLDISLAAAPVHLKRFDRVQTRFLSIAWAWPDPSADCGPSSSDAGSDDDHHTSASSDLPNTVLVTGCSDSCLRVWDVPTGRVVSRMALERPRGERTLVWSVAVLGDGTIISGDSLGTVKFWDIQTATQIHSFPAHNADVLCMAVSPSGHVVYTSGVDQRITQFVKLAGDPPKWVQTTQRRIHSHDVRALAIYPPYAGTATHDDSEIYAPLLFSAGLDMSVAVMPTVPAHAEAEETLSSGPSTFEDGLPKRIGYPISSGNAVLASQARMVLSFSARAVGIWTLPDQPARPDDDLDDGPSGDGGWSKALEMELRFRTNITAGAISPDGRWLAIADVWEVKLFWVDNTKGTLRPRRSRTITQVLSTALSSPTGASALTFTPDSRRLVVATWGSARIVLLDLDERAREDVVRVFDVHPERGAGRESDDGRHEVTSLAPRISRVAVSSDSQWLASADSAGQVCIFNLDSVKHVTTLPRTSIPPSALSFDTRAPHVLAIGYPNNKIHLFDAEAKLFYPALPDKLEHLQDPILGIVFPPIPGGGGGVPGGCKRKMYVWSANWLARFDVAAPSPSALLESPPPWSESDAAETEVGQRAAGSKRKRGNPSGQAGEAFAIVNKFRPVLLVDFCAPVDGTAGQDEMVIVERPLVDLLATLPPAYLKPKYGAS
ncbi:U3 small nucleolar RNA-associated protein [Ceratobasidium theobromae]|uniref:U3 small nucleolar RNA-associated protein n=1 Tax=Ceratobasidium theobromae TaxID=1582974 RepID=A0A5N5QM30_9AGAM|nr:U3 small nucleolar RNA-associated protein [Ceratobasidium theobromae]